jgi:hypothetical protein
MDSYVTFKDALRHIDESLDNIGEGVIEERCYGHRKGPASQSPNMEPEISSLTMERIYGSSAGLHLKISYTHQPSKIAKESRLAEIELSRRVQLAVMDIDGTKADHPLYCAQLTSILDEDGLAVKGVSNSELPEEFHTRENPLQSIDDIFAAYKTLRSANDLRAG